jgi:hypothetical protein
MATHAAYVLEARRPPPLCVRCGRRPRSGETYLCGPCLTDPLARQEAAEATRAGGSYTEQRRVCVERFNWVGGWGRP